MSNTPTDANVPTKPKGKTGQRTFEGDQFALVYNKQTRVYDLTFEGRSFAIRFEAPESLRLLADPLAGGLVHKSGSHTFDLKFKDGKLVSVINKKHEGAFDPGVDLPQTDLVTVPVLSELAKWIVVTVDLPVVKALRTK